MRRSILVGAVLLAAMSASCSSDGDDPKATATAAATTTAAPATTTATGTYATEARALLNDLGTAQRGLADAIAASAPLSDAWKQAVSARVSTFATLEQRAQKLTPASTEQQVAQTQIIIAARRSREAADTIVTAVAEGNISMLERANAILSDAAFQTTAAVARLPR